MGPARIYPWRKMHRSRAPSIAPGTFFVAQSWADFITDMPGFDLRQAQGSFARQVRLELRQSGVLECEMGMQVGLRRFDRLMAEPQRDHGALDACMQQLHRSAVPQHMWRHPLGRQ